MIIYTNLISNITKGKKRVKKRGWGKKIHFRYWDKNEKKTPEGVQTQGVAHPRYQPLIKKNTK